jgi:hypothetical protein
MKTYKTTNIDDHVEQFDNDEDFIKFTQEIFTENEVETEPEDVPWYPETTAECVFYILNYCGNLILEIIDQDAKIPLENIEI